MQIKDLKELIKDLPDDMEVLVEGAGGFISACNSESQVVTGEDESEKMLLIAPCLCNEDLTLDLSADDFPEPNLS